MSSIITITRGLSRRRNLLCAIDLICIVHSNVNSVKRSHSTSCFFFVGDRRRLLLLPIGGLGIEIRNRNLENLNDSGRGGMFAPGPIDARRSMPNPITLLPTRSSSCPESDPARLTCRGKSLAGRASVSLGTPPGFSAAQHFWNTEWRAAQK